MTSLRLKRRHQSHTQWTGRCRHERCDRNLLVNADNWQSKIEVLSQLRDHTARRYGHLHGVINIHGYEERGGE